MNNKKKKVKLVQFEESDPCMSLRQWSTFVKRLIKKYGPQAEMHTDAGPNNVVLVVKFEGP
jgi:hypothetical protein